MEDKERVHLEARVQIAGLYREMCGTAGFKDLRRELETRLADLKNKWMISDEADGAKIKMRAQVYNEVFDIVKSKILQGDMASRQLRGDQEEKDNWAGQSQE